MKKTLKFSLVFLLMIALLFGMTACGNKENNKKNGEESKTYKILSETFSGDTFTFIAEGDIDVENKDEQKGKVTMAVNGENIYMDIESDSERITIIYKNKVSYILSHEEKMYMKLEGEDDPLTKEDAEFVSNEDLEEMKTTKYKTGKETVEGKKYQYEEFKDEEGLTKKYYFEGDTLVYIKSIDEDGKEDLMKIVELSNKVDEKLFEIPSGYQEASL